MFSAVQVSLEFTPNPNTLKFVVSRPLMARGACNFTSSSQTKNKSPLAEQLFEVAGVVSVLLGTNFVTITKGPQGDWDLIAEKVPQTIQDFLAQNSSVFAPGYDPEAATTQTTLKPEDQEIERKIRELLDTEIRPAVAMDGGDITFGKYEDGIVYLSLQGACSSCPSSTATLKMGVETRLKEVIPQIREVVQY
ncbi:MAG: NifU family protein [Proteobacteria bacterium]|nr:NifU family protein [Pseudomonadota bacterium]